MARVCEVVILQHVAVLVMREMDKMDNVRDLKC